MPRPLKQGILGASTIILSKDILFVVRIFMKQALGLTFLGRDQLKDPQGLCLLGPRDTRDPLMLFLETHAGKCTV